MYALGAVLPAISDLCLFVKGLEREAEKLFAYGTLHATTQLIRRLQANLWVLL